MVQPATSPPTRGRYPDPRYKTVRWRKLRKVVLDRAGWRCEWVEDGVRCGRDLREPGQGHADHIEEVRDNPARFWDLDNLRALCKKHHMGKTLLVAADRDRRTPESPNA